MTHRHFKAQVKENIPLSKDCSILTFTPLGDAAPPLPGQFYMISACPSYDPFLKRPFSFFKKTNNSIQILYKVKGKGTMLLKGMEKGGVFDVIGPVGNSYPMPLKEHTPIVIAGGIGIASLLPLIKALKGDISLIYGSRTKNELLMLNELKDSVKDLIICTDDGSYGRKATTIDMLKEIPLKKNCLIYSCGPREMLRHVSRICLKKAVKGYISLEAHMACGLGACLGCVVMTVRGYRRVCKEGPIFRIEDIKWGGRPTLKLTI